MNGLSCWLATWLGNEKNKENDDGKVWDIVRKVVRKIIRKMTFSLRNKDTTFAKQNERWKREEQKSDKMRIGKLTFSLKRN